MSHEMRAAASTGMFASSETERAAEVPARAPERIAREMQGNVAASAEQGWRQADAKRLV